MLQSVTQDEFNAGIVRQVEGQRIPVNGCYDIVDGLLDDDLAVYRRGGCAYESTDGATLALYGVVDVNTAVGQRTVIWHHFDVVGNGTMSLRAGVPQSFDNGFAVAMARGVGISGYWVYKRQSLTDTWLGFYGGAQWDPAVALAPGGATPNLVFTNGSRTVTLTSGSFGATAPLRATNVGLIISEGVASTHFGVIESVQSSTVATLRDPWPFPTYTGAGLYDTAQFIDPPRGFDADDSYLATVGAQARLVVTVGNRAYFSDRGQPSTFDTTNYHELPGTGQITGADSIQDTLLLFTTEGMWAVGNMSYDLTDAFGNVQQVVNDAGRQIILWQDAGIASWRGSLVVPAIDDVYLYGLGQAPIPLAGPIRPLYREYVRAGYRTGLATVHRGQYLLPIWNGTTEWIDTLVCRLDGGAPAWTRWSGQAGESRAFAQRVGASTRTPQLFGLSDDMVTDCTDCFTPSATNKNEADDSTHQLTVITRDFTTRRTGQNLWKYLRARYELEDAATDNPYLTVEYQVGSHSSTWTAVSGNAPESDGTDDFEWTPDLRAQAIRFRIRSNQATARCVLRSLEVFFRPSAKR